MLSQLFIAIQINQVRKENFPWLVIAIQKSHVYMEKISRSSIVIKKYYVKKEIFIAT